MRLLDALVEHPDNDVNVIVEVDHQFLVLLHHLELLLVHTRISPRQCLLNSWNNIIITRKIA